MSLIAIAAVLFTQLAMSAYACPMMSAGLAVTPCLEMTSSTDLPMDQPGLCHKHCQNEQQNLGAFDSAAAAIASAPGFEITLQLAAPVSLPATTPALQHPISPPLPIRHCSLRI
jgi:hypothetical protein